MPITARSTQSKSMHNAQKPMLSPYYVYFGNQKTVHLQSAFKNPGLKMATIAFATAIPGQVRTLHGVVGGVESSPITRSANSRAI
jgi:hypothetical protein